MNIHVDTDWLQQPVSLEKPEHLPLSNGVTVHLFPGKQTETVTCYVLLRQAVHKNPLVPSSTARMLREATRSLPPEQIQEMLDFRGASISVRTAPEYAIFKISSLTRFFREVFEIFTLMLREPAFPDNELRIYQKRQEEGLKVSQQKVEFHANRLLRQQLFGSSHVYGFTPSPGDYLKLSRYQLLEYYSQNYHPANMEIVLAGNFPDDWEQLFEQSIGSLENTGAVAVDGIPDPGHPLTGKEYFPVPGAVQSAIRIGALAAQYPDPGYFGFQVLTTVLGGYFGARLMKNLREDKGYTYGAYTTTRSFTKVSYFYITTEVSADYTDEAIHEIYREMNRLCTEPVKTEELDRVKSYLLGKSLRSIDGPYTRAKNFVNLLALNRSLEDVTRFADIVRNIRPNELLQLANRYFLKKEMIEIVSGPGNP